MTTINPDDLICATAAKSWRPHSMPPATCGPHTLERCAHTATAMDGFGLTTWEIRQWRMQIRHCRVS